MAKLIKLLVHDGQRIVYVNPAHVSSVMDLNPEVARVAMLGSEEPLDVRGPAEKVAQAVFSETNHVPGAKRPSADQGGLTMEQLGEQLG